MHQFWHTITKIKNSSSYKLKLDKKKCTIDVEVFRDILQISPRLPNQEFVVPPSSDEEIVSFIKELGLVMHTIQNDSILGSLRFVSKTKEYQVYGALIPKGMTNQKMQNSPAYKTYLAFATGAATPKKGRRFKKPASPSKKKALVAIEDPAKKPVKKPAAQRQSTSVQIRTLLVYSDDEDADDDQQSDDDRTESDDDKTILATIKSEVQTAVNEYLGTSLDDSLYKVLQRHSLELIKEHSIPADVVEKLQQQQNPQKNEDAMDKGVIDKSNKRKPDDVDRDEGPPTGSNQGLKRKKTSKDTKPSKKAKSTESSKGATKSQPKSTGNAFVMNWLQISDLTQDILVGPAYKLLKGTCRSYVELEYNIEECYKALTDQLDWNNLKRSKREINIHQAGGSGEGADLESKVPDEPKGKSIDTSERTGLKP
nr:hypothetical protein [Tanacetum cinerariifolium]